MIDTVIIHVPVFATFTKQDGEMWEILGDVNDFGLTANSRHVRKGENGQKVITEIYHAYNSLPTSHTGIGNKFYHRVKKCLPYLEINCSIAKLMQGHNVYGADDLVFGSLEMLGAIHNAYPELSKYLDWQNSKIVRFDVTYSAVCENRLQAEKVRDYIRNVNFGRLRNQAVRNTKDHYNTVYFGSDGSRIGGFKIYCKGIEFENQRTELQAKAKKHCLASTHKLQTIFTQSLQDYADKLVRIEATFKSRHLQDLGIPQNLFEFHLYQAKYPNLYNELWQNKTQAMFTALKGQIMNYADDSQVWQLLEDKLTTVTPTGNISKTKALNAFNFYKRIQQDGFYKVKKMHSKTAFHRYVKNLCDCGISLGFLQNLHSEHGKSLPVLEILRIDFDSQLPEGYQPPTITPEFVDLFTPYLLNAA